MAQYSSFSPELFLDFQEHELLTFESYHGKLARHNAEALLQANGKPGSFLVRRSTTKPGNYAVSVRTKSNVLHYAVERNEDGKVTFGLRQFDKIEEFMDHLQGYPMVGSTEAGTAVFLSTPYPRTVEEPSTYTRLNIHHDGGTFPLTSRRYNAAVPSLAGRTGYMVKLGAKVKSWKRRWFVLEQNELKYFKTHEDKKPINTLILSGCSKVEEDLSQNKDNCFSLTFPERTYYMYTNTAEERKQWMELIQFKLTKMKN